MRYNYFFLSLLIACLCFGCTSKNTQKETDKPSNKLIKKTAGTDNSILKLGTGYFEGVITAGTYKVRFELDILKNNRNRLVGAYFSEDQQAYGWPVITVRIDSNNIQFDLPTDVRPMHFSGNLNNDTIAGKTWVFNDEKQYARFKMWKKQRPNFKEFYNWENIIIENEGAKLSGTLRRPANTDSPRPAIIFLPTEGEDRNDHSYFADYFAKQGFVTFNFDKRGTGRSSGNWRTASLETLVNDDLKVVEMVMGVNVVDPERVGVFAKGMGSGRLPMVLNKNEEIAFGVGVSTPGESLLETEFKFKQKVIKDNISDPKEVVDAFKFLRMQYDYALNRNNWDALMQEAELAKQKPWYAMMQVPDDPNHWVFDMIQNQLNFNPIESWKTVEQPILLIQGQYDDYIDPAGYDEIGKALAAADNQAYLKSVIAYADHAMWNVYDDLPLFMVGSASKQYKVVLSDWVKTVAGE